MKTYYIYCLENGKGLIQEIKEDENLPSYIVRHNAMRKLAIKKYGAYSVQAVVSKEWSCLLDNYNKLFEECVNNNLFEKIDVNKRLGDCCGYTLTANSIINYGRVILDDYNDVEIKIADLGIEQFENIICALEEIIEGV